MAILNAAAELLTKQWHLFLAPAFVYLAIWLLQNHVEDSTLSKIPFAGAALGDENKRRTRYFEAAKDVYLEGYHKFKKGVFRITTTRESQVVVVDPCFLNELRDLPDEHLSFVGAVEQALLTPWTKLEADQPILAHVVKRDLTPALNRLNPVIAEEVAQALRDEIPPCDDFTSVALFDKLLRVVAKVSGRVFVGPELCRTEEYIDLAINYTVDLVEAIHVLHGMKHWQRVLYGNFIHTVKVLRGRSRKATDYIMPLVASRMKAAAEDPDFRRPDDMLQWVLDSGQARFGKLSQDQIIDAQLGVTFAAIHTTTMTTTNAFYTIAARPEFVPELREEINSVLKEHGTFTTPALQKMKKLDSFLREVMRTHPIGWTSFTRQVMKPLTLSNGQVIPPGVLVEVASHSAMNDPDVVPNPDVFDPWRSYRLREQEGLQGPGKAGAGGLALNQLVSVNANSLAFGYGRHACPGRFFAANELKMIIGTALLNYDITLPDGVTERYENISIGDSYMPDPTKELLFKRISV